ncbi:MAG: chromate transporter [Bacillota bacterium]
MALDKRITKDKQSRSAGEERKGSLLEVLGVSSRLGLTSFGGPIAHLGYFRDEYVVRRKWLDEKTYADLVALCQFLPGPASSQVGIAIGMIRAGFFGGIVSWFGFTLPSVLALTLFAYALQGFDASNTGWLHGLMIAAVAVVAQAVWGMAKSLAPDRTRASIAISTAIIILLWPSPFSQIALIVAAGLLGWLFLPRPPAAEAPPICVSLSRRAAIASWIIFFALLAILPLIRQLSDSYWLAMFDSFFRVGSLVFGGGHVVLPLLQSEVVPTGWVTDAQFLAGYGAAQAVPGPLFTFASYLGMVMNGVAGAVAATFAIFLPSFLLVTGGLPFWDYIRRRPGFQASLNSINAAVVGILLAALYNPVWIKAIKSPWDFSLALLAFGLLFIWKLPPWLVVLVCALGGMALSFV